MAWTTPRTWTTGELVTAAIMNAHVRDNMNALYPTAVEFVIDGGGAVITTGSHLNWEAPFSCSVDQWTVMANKASGVTFEFYSVSYAGAPPASEDSINSGSPAKVASAFTGQDTNPSTWGTIADGEVVSVVCTGACGVTKATVSLRLSRT